MCMELFWRIIQKGSFNFLYKFALRWQMLFFLKKLFLNEFVYFEFQKNKVKSKKFRFKFNFFSKKFVELNNN